MSNALKIARVGFKANEEGYVYFMGNASASEGYGTMQNKPYAILYFNRPSSMELEKDPDPEALTGPSSFRYKGDFKPEGLSIEVYTKNGEPVDSWHSSRQSIKELVGLAREARKNLVEE